LFLVFGDGVIICALLSEMHGFASAIDIEHGHHFLSSTGRGLNGQEFHYNQNGLYWGKAIKKYLRL
jgi:hypothetical protein